MSNFLCQGMRGQKKMIFCRVLKPPIQNTSMGRQKKMISNFEVVTVMVVQTTSTEEQIEILMKVVEELTKHIQEQDSQITKLINKVDNADISCVMGKQIEVHDKTEVSMKQQSISSDGLIPIDQLKEFIIRTINDKFDGSSKLSLTYIKPYTKRINNLKMPVGYQPLKFQQFDGKGNPKQHIAHFIETYNNAGTYGDCLVKQFIFSLMENAFDWYTSLEANSIDSWEQLEQDFLNRFYSTRRTVNMVELADLRQKEDEPVLKYINNWRNLSLNCKDTLSETSVIEICIQGMQCGLCYILQGFKPKTFGDLATRAHAIELSMNFDKQECPSDVSDDEDDEDEEDVVSYATTADFNFVMLLDTSINYLKFSN
ncbi:hypothetical protein Pfo_007064 [Paulownia fortunei]|nr:hypothetical protein Pfo_007064 [Paulownia fortunei]